MVKKSSTKSEVKQTKKIKKRKVSLFFKINFFLGLFISIFLLYFLLLVSTSPKSFPFVTDIIRKEVRSLAGNESDIRKTSIKFTNYGTLKISIDDLRIVYFSSEGNNSKQVFVIPKTETEISVFNLIFLRFHPKKITFLNPVFVIDSALEIKNFDMQNKNADNQLFAILSILNSINEKRHGIDNIELINSRLIIQNYDKKFLNFLIKESNIYTRKIGDQFKISLASNIEINEIGKEFSLDSNCILQTKKNLDCDLNLQKFPVNYLVNFSQKFKDFQNLKFNLDFAAKANIKNKQITKLNFKATSDSGEFYVKEIFDENIFFKNMEFQGNYKAEYDRLNLENFKINFVDNYSKKSEVSDLNLSLLYSNISQKNNQILDFKINLENLNLYFLTKYWPSFLKNNNAYNWVSKNITNGISNNAKVSFLLKKNGDFFKLQNLDSEVNFQNINLSYGENSPSLEKLSGLAKFSKNGMNIIGVKGKVKGGGNIYNSKITIAQFKNPTLQIEGKLNSNTKTLFNYVKYESELSNKFWQYFRGRVDSNFDVKLPLNKTDLEKKFSINIKSKIYNLLGLHSKGSFGISLQKNSSSNIYNLSADFTNAKLDFKNFSLFKEKYIPAKLDLSIDFDSKFLKISEIKYAVKKDEKFENKFTGNAVLLNGNLVNLEVKNLLGKNDYDLSYIHDVQNFSKKISLKGQFINFANFYDSFKEFQFSAKKSDDKKIPYNIDYNIIANNAYFLNSNNISNLYISYKCQKGFCNNILLKGNYDKRRLFDIKTNDVSKDGEMVEISGNIFDIGFFAESLGISNLISGGDAEIYASNHRVKNSEFYQKIIGEIEINKKFTFYNSETVKRFERNNLFAQLKDKIFTSDKTVFNSSKLDFESYNQKIFINNFIANNLKIGITAKGFYDYDNRIYDFSGMIIPGYIINNLFGIGKIPIVGNVVSNILTGGEKSGGVFGLRYRYYNDNEDKKEIFETNNIGAILPATIQNIFN